MARIKQIASELRHVLIKNSCGGNININCRAINYHLYFQLQHIRVRFRR